MRSMGKLSSVCLANGIYTSKVQRLQTLRRHISKAIFGFAGAFAWPHCETSEGLHLSHPMQSMQFRVAMTTGPAGFWPDVEETDDDDPHCKQPGVSPASACDV